MNDVFSEKDGLRMAGNYLLFELYLNGRKVSAFFGRNVKRTQLINLLKRNEFKNYLCKAHIAI